jgi:hypothetical protein
MAFPVAIRGVPSFQETAITNRRDEMHFEIAGNRGKFLRTR